MRDITNPSPSCEELETSSLTLRAVLFAGQKHFGQTRKDMTAFIDHPIRVMNLLREEAGIHDEEVLAGAILHDVVEDTDTSIEEIEAVFSPAISALVREVTDDPNLTREERKKRQEEKAGALSSRAKLIKIADKTVNCRDVLNGSPPQWSVEQRVWYFDQAKRVVDQCRGENAILDGLFDAVFAQRERLA